MKKRNKRFKASFPKFCSFLDIYRVLLLNARDWNSSHYHRQTWVPWSETTANKGVSTMWKARYANNTWHNGNDVKEHRRGIQTGGWYSKTTTKKRLQQHLKYEQGRQNRASRRLKNRMVLKLGYEKINLVAYLNDSKRTVITNKGMLLYASAVGYQRLLNMWTFYFIYFLNIYFQILSIMDCSHCPSLAR